MASQVFDLKRLKRSFLGLSGLYMLGIPLMLAANIVLARTLSVAEFGIFGFAISVATVLAIPVASGMPMLLTREIAGYVRSENWSAYRGLVISAYSWVAATCVLIGVGGALWWLLTPNGLELHILIAFLLVPFMGMSAVRNGILKGLGRPNLAEGMVQVAQSALLVLCYLCLMALSLSSAVTALWWYLSITVVIVILTSWVLIRVQPTQVSESKISWDDFPRWRRSVLPFALMSAAAILNSQIAVLLLGFTGQEEAVAQMRVAERGAQLITFPLHLINMVLGPYFVQALHDGDRQKLRSIARTSVLLTSAISFPASLVFLFFGENILGWTFGQYYADQSYMPLVILIFGQLITVALGSGSVLLAMSGHQVLVMVGSFLSLAIVAVIVGFLGASLGSTGAAIGVAIGMVFGQTLYYFAVRRIHKVSPGVI